MLTLLSTKSCGESKMPMFRNCLALCCLIRVVSLSLPAYAQVAPLDDALRSVATEIRSGVQRVLERKTQKFGLAVDTMDLNDSDSAALFSYATEKLMAQLRSTETWQAELVKVVSRDNLSDDLTALRRRKLTVLILLGIVHHETECEIHARAVDTHTGANIVRTQVAYACDSQIVSPQSAALDTQLRRLVDRVVEGLDRLVGDLRYQHFAVLPFEEIGDAVSKPGVGRYVASQLATTLRRDHSLLVLANSYVDEILEREQWLPKSTLSPAELLQLGQALNVQGVIVGSIDLSQDEYHIHFSAVSTVDGELSTFEETRVPMGEFLSIVSDEAAFAPNWSAFYRSLAFPGWGQYQSKAYLRAGLFGGSELLALGLAIYFHALGSRSQDRYDNLGLGASAKEFSAAAEQAQNAYGQRNIALWSALAIYAASATDALLFDHVPASVP